MSFLCMNRSQQTLLSLAFWSVLLVEAFAQQPPQPPNTAPQPPVEAKLQFAFDGAPWREVIKWLAEESQLALHVGDTPPGSFTYSDPGSFTIDQAIDRVNLFLLSENYTLVRSGRMLSVINLSDPRSLQQLDVLAKLVAVDQLAQLGDHDVVKCIFPLGDIKAEAAAEELSALKLITEPVIFTKTNRLMITESVAKLKSARAILNAFEPSALDDGTVVKNFALQHADAEDILTVVRPHLGLATGEMIGIDVSLSADLQGNNIFVSGSDDKVKLIENLVSSLDKPQRGLDPDAATAELKSHLVQAGNVETVYNVLQTLLAEKPVRLSMDETAGAIVAWASAEVQKEIADTVAQLQAAEAEFAVIPLKNVDPYFVVSLLDEMLDLPDPLLDDPEDIDPDAPKIDADPGAMRLFVRGKKHQIEQIQKIVKELDAEHAPGDDEDTIRLFPLRGKRAQQVLEMAAPFWRGENPLIFYPATQTEQPLSTERIVAESDADGQPAKKPPRSAAPRVLGGDPRSSKPPVRCQVTPRGLLLQSEDSKALDQFYKHLQTIAGPTNNEPLPPVVFYLKYTKPSDALRVLSELLDGGEAALEGEAGTLVNGYVYSSSSVLGSLVSSQAGTTTLTAGTMTVVADSRLNRLIAQGTANDIQLIENYLKIIDKDASITEIETYGRSHVIELKHVRASEIAEVVREAYFGRVSGGPRQNAANQNQLQGRQSQVPQQRNPTQPQNKASSVRNPEGRPNSKSGDGKTQNGQQPSQRRPSTQPAPNLEPKLTLAVHEPSNSLIVTAPERLFQEVEMLVKRLDSSNEQATQVISVSNPAKLQMLQQLFSAERDSRTSTARPTTPAPVSPQPPTARRGNTR